MGVVSGACFNKLFVHCLSSIAPNGHLARSSTCETSCLPSKRTYIPAMFWLVFSIDDEKCVWIDEASDITSARLKASMAGYLDGFVEWHELDEKMARKV